MPLGSVRFSLTRTTGANGQWFATMFANLAAHGITLQDLAGSRYQPTQDAPPWAIHGCGGSFFNDQSDRSVMPCEALVFLRP